MSGKTYVDGGVVSLVAVDVARRYGADVVIALDISGGVAGAAPQGTMDTILQAIDIILCEDSRLSDPQCRYRDPAQGGVYRIFRSVQTTRSDPGGGEGGRGGLARHSGDHRKTQAGRQAVGVIEIGSPLSALA